MDRSKLIKKACTTLFFCAFILVFGAPAFAAQNSLVRQETAFSAAISGHAKTLTDLRRAAATGDAGAQRSLGERYATGRGVKQKDSVRAAAWLIIAGLDSNGQRGGSPVTLSKLQTRMTTAQIADAWNQVGVLYATGQAGKNTQAQARHWFRKAAEAGNADAQYALGLRYEQGRGRVQSNAEAARYYLDAAAQGQPRALEALQSMARSGVGEAETALGWLYASGQGVGRDYGKAYYWWHKAAGMDDPVAQVNLGSLYESGSGVARDYRKAAYWYRKAGALGDATAQAKIGMLYTSGHGVAQNDTIAAAWFKRAASNGNTEALVKLGELYAKGQGVQKNPARAAAYFAQAAQRGNPDGLEALGSALAQGQGVSRDKERAAVLFMLARTGGNARASQSLSRLQATLSPKQLARAQRHAEMWRTLHAFRRASHGDLAAFGELRKMARDGNTGAQVALGTLYNAGVLMETDLGKAAAWYRKAAKQGSGNAEYNLAELYVKGQGVSKDPVKALEYLMVSAAHGNRRASAQAAALKWQMSPAQIAEAKQNVNGMLVADATP